jgi:hypothetical protein
VQSGLIAAPEVQKAIVTKNVFAVAVVMFPAAIDFPVGFPPAGVPSTGDDVARLFTSRAENCTNETEALRVKVITRVPAGTFDLRKMPPV